MWGCEVVGSVSTLMWEGNRGLAVWEASSQGLDVCVCVRGLSLHSAALVVRPGFVVHGVGCNQRDFGKCFFHAWRNYC